MKRLTFFDKKVIFPFMALFFCSIVGLYTKAFAFDLSVTVSGGSGSWNSGIYQITGSQDLNFSCTPSGGTVPYSYCWTFPTIDGMKDSYGTVAGTKYDDQNPASVPISNPGKYVIEVEVTDNTSAVERAYLIVEMLGARSPVRNAKTDCGCAGDGSTDDTTALQNCMDALDSGGVIEFPAGAYRIVGAVNILAGDAPTNATVGIKVNKDDITLRPASGVAIDQVQIEFDPGNTNGSDTVDDMLFCLTRTGGRYRFYIRDITLKYNSPTDYSNDDVSYVVYCHYGNALGNEPTIERCVIDSFSRPLLGRVQVRENNIINWGWTGGREAGIYPGGNAVIWRNYSNPKVVAGEGGSSYFIYGGLGTWYNYIVENWIDQTEMWYGENDKGCIKYYGNPAGATTVWPVEENDRDTLGYVYIDKNYFIGGISYIIEIRNKEDNKVTKQVHISNNIFKNNGKDAGANIKLLFLNSDVYSSDSESDYYQNITFHDNLFFRSDGYSGIRPMSFGYDLEDRHFGPGINIYNNTYGNNYTGSNPNSISDTGFYGLNGNINDGIQASGNTNNTSTDSTSDPGPWEFNPPANCFVSISNGDSVTSYRDVTLLVSATDIESGMGPGPRWPLNSGGLIQVSNDGITWSETRPYANTTAWKLTAGSGERTVWARFRDVDGNWTDPVLDTIVLTDDNGIISSPTGLEIISLN